MLLNRRTRFELVLKTFNILNILIAYFVQLIKKKKDALGRLEPKGSQLESCTVLVFFV